MLAVGHGRDAEERGGGFLEVQADVE